MVPFTAPLREGRLVRRYKRFFADVLLDGIGEVTAHCANPGSMLGVFAPGRRALVAHVAAPGRRLDWSLELIRVRRAWVGANPARANRVVADALERRRIPELAGYPGRRGEPAWPEGGRADFLLEAPDRPRCWVEVKNVTLARDRLALFPDSVTERGRRHMDALRARARSGDRAVLLLVAARADVDAVGPADDIDPRYGEALRQAAGSGVEVLGYRMRITRGGLALSRAIPLDPGPHPAPTPGPERRDRKHRGGKRVAEAAFPSVA
jgi:sugar fermentation stimulation protein A